VSERRDAVVIGSGAGGSVMAFELARRGLDVTVVEAGARWVPQTFEHDELAMFVRAYKHSGLQGTKDHDSLIVQGFTVGGSTVINNAIFLRADLDRVLADWAAAGAPVERAPLEAAYDELERALHVEAMPPKLANAGAKVFLDGCTAAGIRGELLRHNRNTCIACGWCNYGCRYDRKTSMLVTYIPWAEARGAQVLDSCRDVEVLANGHRARGVRFVRDGQEQVVEADRVVVSAGAIGSSGVLLRSGIDLDGRVGRGLHMLGGLFVTAEMEDPVEGFDGIGLCAIAHAGREIVIESYFAPPLVFSLRLGGWFGSHFNRMLRYRHFVDGGAMVGTDPTGVVKLNRKKEVEIDFAFSQRDLERLVAGTKTLARIYLGGGALRVFPSSYELLEIASEEDLGLLDERITRPDDLSLGSAHPQGGNAMSEDPARGVVGTDFRVHGYENLFVADASVFPTNIWANCQATVMAMAHHAASFVAADA
jgi:choline dehydrogenase-like flavoprotein